MQKFIDVLSSKLRVSSSDWDWGIARQSVNVPVDEKCKKHYTELMREKLVYDICTGSYCLQFSYVNDTTVELGIIEVFEPGKGLGTEVMNHILDTCDELGITVKTVPAPIVPEEEVLYGKRDPNAFKIIQRLRRYYSSLGFKFMLTTKAVMFYKPQK
jgi:GNAT superfamily N-acetyltransferase